MRVLKSLRILFYVIVLYFAIGVSLSENIVIAEEIILPAEVNKLEELYNELVDYVKSDSYTKEGLINKLKDNSDIISDIEYINNLDSKRLSIFTDAFSGQFKWHCDNSERNYQVLESNLRWAICRTEFYKFSGAESPILININNSTEELDITDIVLSIDENVTLEEGTSIEILGVGRQVFENGQWILEENEFFEIRNVEVNGKIEKRIFIKSIGDMRSIETDVFISLSRGDEHYGGFNYDGIRINVVNEDMINGKGKILNYDGSLIEEKLRIDVQQLHGTYYNQIQNRSDGSFILEGLEDGEYIITVYPYVNTPYCKSDDISITIENGKLKLNNDKELIIYLNKPQIIGKVTNYDIIDNSIYQERKGDALIMLGTIEINSKDNPSIWNRANINIDGSFYIGGLKEGSYNIKAIPRNDLKKAESDEITINIDKDGNYTGEEVILEFNEPSIEGIVLQPNGEILSTGGVLISIMDSNGNWIYSEFISKGGKFYVGKLQDGLYKITAEPNPDISYFGKSFDKIIEIKDGKILGESQLLELRLSEPQFIGEVANLGSTEWNRGNVFIYDDTGNRVYDTTIAHYSNLFYIGGLNPGKYKIEITPREDSNLYKHEFIIEIDSDYKYVGIDGNKDNPYIIELLEVRPELDINDDGDIDILDIALLATDYGKQSNDIGWNSSYDFISDGIIDIYDLIVMSKYIYI